MKAMVATKLLTPMVLILGAALPALAQAPGPATSFEGFGCRIDLTEVAGVPTEFRQILLTTDTLKRCPGSAPTPVIQMECDLLIPGWDPAARINTRNHDCEIKGEQCGFPDILEADNVHLQIRPVVIDGEVFGDARLRCSRSTAG
jgi:hypothetical protein